MEEYLQALAEEMADAIEALERRLKAVRTGRATPQILDSVQVEVSAYGTSMPLQQLASVKVADARLLVVTPWDKSTLSDIEKSIGSAGLGLNPANDGNLIRVPIPALTGERRREMVKVVGRYGEEARVHVRKIRREYNDLFKTLESDGEISKDDLERTLKQVQGATDGNVTRVGTIISLKEKEILEV